MRFPEKITDTEELEMLLARPSQALVDMMRRLEGDVMILGIAGKMGLTMGRRALNAVRAAGVDKQVIGVSRFSSQRDRDKLDSWGVKTIACDLLDREAVQKLPEIPNVIFMAGRKFGTEGAEELTWAMNVLVPWYVAERFCRSRIVAFSTGCVYPLRGIAAGGCTETDVPAPVGEYSQSCLGRERIFQHAARVFGTRSVLLRLNYAIDLRYGVLHDIARQIWSRRPVCDTSGFFNVIWQGDANDYALRALELASVPATVLNVTGPETASTRQIATELAARMNLPVAFTDTFHDATYLNNAGFLHGLMGYPSIALSQLVRWQAEWFLAGGESLDKPTHFEVADGKF